MATLSVVSSVPQGIRWLSSFNPYPPRAQRVFWAVIEGLVAATLLLAGGLQALRRASLTSGLPMTLLLLLAA
ncbi:choline transport protein BetT [Thiorhodovibrio winogradskyi]|uniref:Choline transport protein BetT n=1 Tax=Thiorhodovibrio winogradskyi TaxID=77007 RepID=A0ABZ0SCH2_9GAMM